MIYSFKCFEENDRVYAHIYTFVINDFLRQLFHLKKQGVYCSDIFLKCGSLLYFLA